MKILSALRLIETLEEHMFLAYDRLEKTFTSDAGATAFFSALKKDELSHRSLANEQISIAENSPELGNHEVRVDIAAMNETIELLQGIQNNPPGSLKEALALTYVLESTSVENYVANLLKGSTPEIDKLLDKYANAFCKHMEDVLGFIKLNRLAPISPKHRQLIQLRVPYKAKVRVGGTVDMPTSDISEGGLFVTTSDHMDKGEELELILPMPGEPIEINARVQSVHPGSGAGLSFSKPTAKQAAAIKDYIDNSIAESPIMLRPLPPLKPKEQPTEKQPVKLKPKPKQETSERVLFINNSVFARGDINMFVMAVQDAGHGAYLANSLNDAREKLSDETRDRTIILSAETANDESFGLLEVIRRDPAYSNVPIIILSTSYDRVFINRVDAYGAHFVKKTSITPESLLAMIG